MRNAVWAGLAIIAGLFLVALLGPGPGPDTTRQATAPESLPTGKPTVIPDSMRARLRAREQVTIENFRPSSKGSGQISELNGTLKNLGNRDVKDVEVTCEYQGGSGTVLDRKVQTVYDNIAAGKSIPVRGLTMGLVADQSKTVSCTVSDVKLR